MPFRLLLSGGGSGGSVTPLLAVVEEARAEGKPYVFLWAGTTYGPERMLIQHYQLPFYSLSSGKWRRYFSGQNLVAPVLVALGFWQSWRLLVRERPAMVLTAGGFVSVPLVWAAWCLGIPVAVHEQDVDRGLANALMRPCAALRTSVWPMPGQGGEVYGNFVRPSIQGAEPEQARQRLGLPPGLPVVLAIGGGTGALRLNGLVAAAAPLLLGQAQIIHLTGYGKEVEVTHPNYRPRPFALDAIADLLAAADLVVTRAGMAYLSELAVLSKPIIVVPMPQSHQERNADLLQARGAAVVLSEPTLTAVEFAATMVALLHDAPRRQALGQALHALIPDGTKKFLQRLEDFLP